MNSIQMTTNLSDKAFFEMLASSPRQVREVLFSRFQVKSSTSRTTISPVERRFERAAVLKLRLNQATSSQEETLCKELIRNWLYTKRPMLKAAMDFLGIKNDNGLVDNDEGIFDSVTADKARALYEHLAKSFDPEEVALYLRFMAVPHAEKAILA